VVDWVTAGLTVTAAVLLLTTRVNSVWLVAGGALVGALRAILG
jgi:chromate transporter